MPGGSVTNPKEATAPKTVRELTAFCTSLETTMRAELQGLKESTNVQLRELLTKAVPAPLSADNTIVSNSQCDATFLQAVNDMQVKLEAQIAAVTSSLNRELDAVRGTLCRLDALAVDQAEEIDAAEQYARRNCLLIHGIPEVPNENPYHTILSFAKDKLDVALRLEDIDRCHRLGPPRRNSADVVTSGRPRPLIIKFVRYVVRAEMWSVKKRLKNQGLLISESLTKKRLKMYSTIRDIVGVGSVWTQDGKIIVLRPDGSRLSVTRERDMQSVTKSHQK